MRRRDRLASRIWSSAAYRLNTDVMRPVARRLSRLHAVGYRLTGGRAQVRAFPMLLLSVRGRRTDQVRTVPLIYVRDRDRYVVAAAYAGSDRDPTWWLNLQANPDAGVEIRGVTTPVRAGPAPAAEQDRLWRLLAEMYPPMLDYQRRTARRIPVVVLTPTGPGVRGARV